MIVAMVEMMKLVEVEEVQEEEVLVEGAIPDGILVAELSDLLFVGLGTASKNQGSRAVVRNKIRPSIDDQSDGDGNSTCQL